MKLFKLFLPGEFEDAFLYKERLLVMTVDKELRAYDLEGLARRLAEKSPSSVPAPYWLFARNDFIGTNQFRKFVEADAIAKAVAGAFGAMPSMLDDITHDLPLLDQFRLDAFDCDMVLDLTIYNDRMYLATDEGLFHIDFDFSRKVPKILALHKRSDIHSMAVSAKYGSVSVSCGDDGLWIAEGDFEQSKEERPTSLAVKAERSVMTNWWTQSLVNYEAYNSPKLLAGERRRSSASLEGLSVVELGKTLFPIGALVSEKAGIETNQIDYIFNFSKKFFVHSIDGSIYDIEVLDKDKKRQRSVEPSEHEVQRVYKFEVPAALPYLLGAQDKELVRPKSARELTGDTPLPKDAFGQRLSLSFKDSIVSSGHTRVGTVIESRQRVQFLHDEGFLDLLNHEAITVRTFMQSKFYGNMVAVVDEDGLWLISVFDERVLNPTAAIARRRLGQGTVFTSTSSFLTTLKQKTV
jgi:hypothetical protein